ncbi:MAG TPA: 5-formyltetrahydrofolate cyclo-ligase [Microvirga sp.]|jgi:5-formyltetrahydrofolate cyclo-ligase
MSGSSPSGIPSLPEIKARLRADALARRDALDEGFRAEASAQVAERVLALPDLKGLQPVGAFWPIRSEIDTLPILDALAARGQTLCLPVVAKPTMLFRAWAPGTALVRGGFGVSAPPPEAPVVRPRALLVPLAAFDRQGGRIGYGKGHYDGAIAALEAEGPLLTIGVAFAAQEVASVPLEPHDRCLDCIVTEADLIRVS